MSTGDPASGTLPETQVRAMFDRIAGVYDRMNSVMTAGHAPPLARAGGGPGRGSARVAGARRGHRHGRPGGRARRARRRGGRASTSRRACSSWRGQGPGARVRVQGNALDLPYADGSFDAVTVGFGARNFSDLDRGLARDGARGRARRARGGPRDHDAAAAAAVVVLPALVRPRRARARAAWPATPTPTPTCRSACGASRARGAGARLAAAGLDDVRWVLTAGGIIAIHRGRRPVSSREHDPGAARRGAGGRRARSWRGCWSAPRRAWPRWPGATARSWAARRGTLSAGGKRLRPMLVFLCARRGTSGSCRRRRPWSCSTWRRSCTTTCSTAPRCAAGGPTVFAEGGRPAATATGDLLFSRAFAELGATGSAEAVRALSDGLVGAGPRRADAARRRLARRRDARALPRALPAEDGEPVRGACRLGALLGGRPGAADGARALRRAHRRGLPDPRRRARRVRAGRADRQAARRGPAGRHGHAAADPGPRARPRLAELDLRR